MQDPDDVTTRTDADRTDADRSRFALTPRDYATENWSSNVNERATRQHFKFNLT